MESLAKLRLLCFGISQHQDGQEKRSPPVHADTYIQNMPHDCLDRMRDWKSEAALETQTTRTHLLFQTVKGVKVDLLFHKRFGVSSQLQPF